MFSTSALEAVLVCRVMTKKAVVWTQGHTEEGQEANLECSLEQTDGFPFRGRLENLERKR